MGEPEHRVTALRMGALTVDSTVLVTGLDAGTTIEIPVSAAAVEGNGLRIVDERIAKYQSAGFPPL